MSDRISVLSISLDCVNLFISINPFKNLLLLVYSNVIIILVNSPRSTGNTFFDKR